MFTKYLPADLQTMFLLFPVDHEDFLINSQTSSWYLESHPKIYGIERHKLHGTVQNMATSVPHLNGNSRQYYCFKFLLNSTHTK